MTTITLDLYPLHQPDLKGHEMEMSGSLNGNQPKIISIFFISQFSILLNVKWKLLRIYLKVLKQTHFEIRWSFLWNGDEARLTTPLMNSGLRAELKVVLGLNDMKYCIRRWV